MDTIHGATANTASDKDSNENDDGWGDWDAPPPAGAPRAQASHDVQAKSPIVPPTSQAPNRPSSPSPVSGAASESPGVGESAWGGWSSWGSSLLSTAERLGASVLGLHVLLFLTNFTIV